MIKAITGFNDGHRSVFKRKLMGRMKLQRFVQVSRLNLETLPPQDFPFGPENE
ncbi:hypothetical protein V6L78_24155 [Pseudomonas canadensis]|uniref:hypothetical protein n=1 Tax=Pseudomonas canadensis TaxID=915099 RepID=UPI0030CE065D